LTVVHVFDTFAGMRSREEYEEVVRLVATGMNDSAISRATGISRTTIREWRTGKIRGDGRVAGRCAGDTCGTVEHAIGHGHVYAYLLGQYLGDGMLSSYPRGVYRLRIACTATYPEIIEEVAASVATIRGSERIGFTERTGVVEVSAYWKHWPCMFPQHGAGPKWKRPIVLRQWQTALVEAHPWPLLRGLIHSDGCRHINTVRRPVSGTMKRYRYSRYIFTNASDDIRRLFTDTCEAVGVHWTQTNPRNVAVSRRSDVELMDRFIGPKS
jgi:uncharacterized protein YerC